jgi:hypothetical protein
MKEAAVAISGDDQVQQIKQRDEYSHWEKVSTIFAGLQQNNARSRLAPSCLLPRFIHDPQHSATIPVSGRSFSLLSHTLKYEGATEHFVHVACAIKRRLERD